MSDCYWSLFNQRDRSRFDGLQLAQARIIVRAIPQDDASFWLAWKEGTPEWQPLLSFAELFQKNDHMTEPLPTDPVLAVIVELENSDLFDLSQVDIANSAHRTDTKKGKRAETSSRSFDPSITDSGKAPLVSQQFVVSVAGIESPRSSFGIGDLAAQSEFNQMDDDVDMDLSARSISQFEASLEAIPQKEIKAIQRAKPNLRAVKNLENKPDVSQPAVKRVLKHASLSNVDTGASAGGEVVVLEISKENRDDSQARRDLALSLNEHGEGVFVLDESSMAGLIVELDDTRKHSDKRKSSRYARKLEAYIEVAGSIPVKTRTSNISLGGVRLERAIPLAAKKTVTIILSRGKESLEVLCEAIPDRHGGPIRSFRILSLSRIDLLRTWLLAAI